MTSYSYGDTANKMEFVKGNRDAIKEYLEDSSTNGTEDIFFSQDSATIITGDVEYGAYYPASEISESMTSYGVGKLSAGKTRAYFEARPIRDILDEILFLTPTEISSKSTKTNNPWGNAKQYTAVSIPANTQIGTLIVEITNTDGVSSDNVGNIKLNGKEDNSFTKENTRSTKVTLSKNIYFSDLEMTGNYSATTISNGVVTEGTSGWEDSTKSNYIYVNLDNDADEKNKFILYSITFTVKGKQYLTKVGFSFDFNEYIELDGATVNTPSVTPIQYSLQDSGTIYKRVSDEHCTISNVFDTNRSEPIVNNTSVNYGTNALTISNAYSLPSNPEITTNVAITISEKKIGDGYTEGSKEAIIKWGSTTNPFATVNLSIGNNTANYTVSDDAKSKLVSSNGKYYACDEAGVKTSSEVKGGTLTYATLANNTASYVGVKYATVSNKNSNWTGSNGVDYVFYEKVGKINLKSTGGHNSFTVTKTNSGNTSDLENLCTLTLDEGIGITPTINVSRYIDSLKNPGVTTGITAVYENNTIKIKFKTPTGGNISGYNEFIATVSWTYQEALSDIQDAPVVFN